MTLFDVLIRFQGWISVVCKQQEHGLCRSNLWNMSLESFVLSCIFHLIQKLCVINIILLESLSGMHFIYLFFTFQFNFISEFIWHLIASIDFKTINVKIVGIATKKQQKEFRSQYVWRSARSPARFLEYFKHILNISMAIHTRTCFCVFHAADVLVKIVQCAAHLSIDVRMAISITT